METHRFSLNRRRSRLAHPKRLAGARESIPLEPRNCPLPPSVTTWLEALPTEWRKTPVSCLDKLGGRFVSGHLRDPLMRPHIVKAVEFVSNLALAHLEGDASIAFVNVLRTEPRLIELGLLVAMSRLSLSKRMPRDQEFYPAVLFDREVLRVVKHMAERDQPAVALLWNLVALHEPARVEEIGAILADVRCGFAKTTEWPSREVAARVRELLSSLRNRWELLASELLAVTDATDGKLPMFAVENAAKPWRMLRVNGALLIESINRVRQKRLPRDLLLMAMEWPNRALRILDNLAGDNGGLRLYGAYVQAVWSGLLAAAQKCRDSANTPLRLYGEVLERDVAYPIFASIETLEEVVTIFADACSYDPMRKKRLSRQRERCLREGLVVMDAQWVETLHDIGTSYSSTSVINAPNEGPYPRALRRDERAVVL